tara:strand:+ start:1165 stop:3363 length:2199 start_codon:yes stop_codon:yes gene_type:complete
MPLNKITFKSGIVSDITPYSNEGGFVDGDKIRFRLGSPEKIGGWSKFSPNTYLGSARRLLNWVALDGSDFLGVGTHLKYYIEEGQTFNDITPIRSTINTNVTFTTNTVSDTEDSTFQTVLVSANAHGANLNDFVTISNADTAVGGIAASTIGDSDGKEHQIVEIVSSNQFRINVGTTASSATTGAAKSSGSVELKFQINTGLDVTVGGTGWGAGQWSGTTTNAAATTINEGGTYSDSDTTLTVASSNPAIPAGGNHQIVATDILFIDNELITVTNVATNDLTVTRASSGTTASSHADGTTVRLAKGNADAANDFVGWGNAASVRVPGAQIRLWSHDNFGEDIIINPRDGGLFYWDKTDGTSTRAVKLNTRAGTKTSIPTVAKQIIVSDQDRHVIVFGCDGLASSSTDTDGDGVQDPLLIRFSSQENPLDFFPTTTNTAGDIRLGGGSEFVQAVETKEQILVYTNKTLHSMRFIGPPFTFGIKELSKNITIMSPSSAIAVDDSVYWMGVDTFYLYNGQTQQLPCSVKDKVFLDLNIEERDKVHAGANTEFSEIWWFYPSSSSTEIDKYVIYNYLENIWYFGSLARQAWLDRGIRALPLATGGQNLFNHETGFDDDGSAMTSFVESAPMILGGADRFSFINRIVPDVSFAGSTSINPQVDFTIKARTHSGSGFTQTDDSNTSQRTATNPVEVYTEKLDVRVRGRTFALRVEATEIGTKFKLGSPQINIVQDGRR